MKIISAIRLGAAAALGVTAFVGWLLYDASSQATEINRYGTMAANLSHETARLEILANEYLLFHEQRTRKQWLQQLEVVRKGLNDIQDFPGFHHSVTVVSDLFWNVERLFDRLDGLRNVESSIRTQPEAKGVASSQTIQELEIRLVNQLLVETQKMFSETFRLSTLSQNLILESQQEAGLTAMVAMISLFLFLLFLFATLRRKIMKPLDTLREGVRIIGGGDLKHAIPLPPNDEVGLLAGEFNHMAHRLLTITVSREVLAQEVEKHSKTMEALRGSEARWRSITEHSLDHILLLAPDGMILFVNHPLPGLTCDAMLGRTLYQLLAPEVETLVRSAVEQTVRSGAGSRFEIAHSGVSGHLVYLEGRVGQVARDGFILGVTVSISDITRRKEVEQELAGREELLRATLEATRDGILVVNRQGHATHVNARFAEMWRIPHELLQEGNDQKLLDHVLSQLVDSKGFLAKVQQLYQSDQTAYDTLLFHDGRVFERFSSPLMQGGVMNGRVWSFWDSTERLRLEAGLRKAKEEAERANHAKSAFVAAMSHEIRTPMNGVLGVVELLRNTKLDEQQKNLVDTISQSGRTLQYLLNDVLDLSKIEAGALDLEQIAFDIAPLVRGIAQLMLLRAQDKGLDFHWTIDPKTPETLIGDPTRLRQVLFNLIGNALKFTEHGGVTLVVKALDQSGEQVSMEFSVQDTGIGIAQEVQEHIFEPFTQADSSTTRRFGGTGLGLSICKRLAEAMHGKIVLESTPGVGSLFRLQVPLSIGWRTKEADPATLSSQPTPSMAILLVEDEPVNQLVARGLLERSGHRVTVAGDGFKALKLVSEISFDLVLMDLHMPGLDGLETTSRLRAQFLPERQPPPVVALTGNVLRETMKRCMDAGMYGVLTKPVQVERIEQVLAEIAGLRAGHTPATPATSREERRLISTERLEFLRESLGVEKMAYLVNLFEESGEQLMARAVDHWHLEAYEQLAIDAHGMIGKAANMGMEPLMNMSRAMENAARTAQAEEIERTFPEWERIYLNSLVMAKKWLTEHTTN